MRSGIGPWLALAAAILTIPASCGGVTVAAPAAPAAGNEGQVSIHVGTAPADPVAGGLPPDDAAAPADDASSGNLVENGSFDQDTASWVAEYGMDVSWEEGEAPGAGALVVSDRQVADRPEFTMGGARQCIAVSQVVHAVAARVFIPAGQGEGAAGVDLRFFAAADCDGAPIGPVTTILTEAVDTWAPLRARVISPADAHAVVLRLVVKKPFRQTGLRARFDDVAFQPD